MLWSVWQSFYRVFYVGFALNFDLDKTFLLDVSLEDSYWLSVLRLGPSKLTNLLHVLILQFQTCSYQEVKHIPFSLFLHFILCFLI